MLQKELQKLKETATLLNKTGIDSDNKRSIARSANYAFSIGECLCNAEIELQKQRIIKLEDLKAGIVLDNNHLSDLKLRGRQSLPPSIFKLYYDHYYKYFILSDIKNKTDYKFKPEETTEILDQIIKLDFA